MLSPTHSSQTAVSHGIPSTDSVGPVQESPVSLIDPEFLVETRRNPEMADRLVVLEAHFSSVDHPLDPDMPVFRHIPGAIQLHPSYLEAGLNRNKYYPNYDHPEEANVLPDLELTRALHHLGITPDSIVVVYGSDPDGIMAAARLVWGLMYAGVKCIRLLDGGIDAWINHGQTATFEARNVWNLESSKNILTPHHSWTFRREFLATTEEVRSHVTGAPSRPVGKLIDVRTTGEWDGTAVKKYPFFSRAGHIPGAIHQGDWNNLMDGSSKRLSPHLPVVAGRWRKQGIIDESVEDLTSPLTFYCGTGWRSSIAFLVAHLLGYHSRNYEEGFYWWSHDPDHPVGVAN